MTLSHRSCENGGHNYSYNTYYKLAVSVYSSVVDDITQLDLVLSNTSNTRPCTII